MQERMRKEFDVKTHELPDDVEAFVTKAEERAATTGLEPLVCADVPYLVAIIREQAMRIKRRKSQPDESMKLTDDAQDIVAALLTKRNAQRDRVGRLEALLVRVQKHWGPGASSDECECVGCAIQRDITAEFQKGSDDGQENEATG